MKKIRRTNIDARKKKRKDAEKQLAEKTAIFANHPTECCVCREPFERTQETVKTWIVTVREEKKRARLTCPNCWDIISKVVENRNGN